MVKDNEKWFAMKRLEGQLGRLHPITLITAAVKRGIGI